jgi:hypothetical protein
MNPSSVRAYQRQLIRDSYANDPAIRCVRSRMLDDLAHGDALMAHHKLPTQAVVEQLQHIFALWRTP